MRSDRSHSRLREHARGVAYAVGLGLLVLAVCLAVAAAFVGVMT